MTEDGRRQHRGDRMLTLKQKKLRRQIAGVAVDFEFGFGRVTDENGSEFGIEFGEGIPGVKGNNEFLDLMILMELV